MDRVKVKSLCGDHRAGRITRRELIGTVCKSRFGFKFKRKMFLIQFSPLCVTDVLNLQAFFTRFPFLDCDLSRLMAPCEPLPKLLQPAGSSLSACNTKQQQKQRQLQPHILGSDVEGLMKYPVPINLSPGGAGDWEP